MNNNEKQHCPKCEAVEMDRGINWIAFECNSEWRTDIEQNNFRSKSCYAYEIDQLRAQLEKVTRERNRLLDDMQNILEYWNCAPEAAVNAIEHARDVAATALEEIAVDKEGK